MSDGIGYGDFACLGNPIIRTPTLMASPSKVSASRTSTSARRALRRGLADDRPPRVQVGGHGHILERERLSLKATTSAQALKSQAVRHRRLRQVAPRQTRTPISRAERGFDEVFIHGAGGIGQTYAGQWRGRSATRTSTRPSFA